MAWSTGDLLYGSILNDGTGAMCYIADGTIYVGQAVYCSDDNKVKVTTSSAGECDAIGVASINASNNDRVGVYQSPNVVKCCLDAAGSPGSPVFATNNGVLSPTQGNSKKVAGYQLEAATLSTGNTNYVGKVLLV